jgi:hypothetical protein
MGGGFQRDVPERGHSPRVARLGFSDRRAGPWRKRGGTALRATAGGRPPSEENAAAPSGENTGGCTLHFLHFAS